MEYGDKANINMLINSQLESKRKNENCATINGIKYHFERRELPVAGISLLLPREFDKMPLEVAQRKYLSESRPEVIFTSPSFTVDFTVKPTNLPFNKDNIMQHLKEIQAIRKKLHPEDLFLDMEVVDLEDIFVGFVEFVSYTMDGRAFNLVLVLPHAEKMVLCTFTCDYECAEKWTPIIDEIINSIKNLDIEVTK